MKPDPADSKEVQDARQRWICRLEPFRKAYRARESGDYDEAARILQEAYSIYTDPQAARKRYKDIKGRERKMKEKHGDRWPPLSDESRWFISAWDTINTRNPKQGKDWHHTLFSVWDGVVDRWQSGETYGGFFETLRREIARNCPTDTPSEKAVKMFCTRYGLKRPRRKK